MAGSAHGRRGHVTPRVAREDEPREEAAGAGPQGHSAKRDSGSRPRRAPGSEPRALHPGGCDPAEQSPCDRRGVSVMANVHPRAPGSASHVWSARHAERHTLTRALNTHIHTLTHILTRTLNTHSHTHQLACSLTCSHAHSTHIHTLTCALTHSHAHTLTCSQVTHTLTHTLTHVIAHTFSHT